MLSACGVAEDIKIPNLGSGGNPGADEEQDEPIVHTYRFDVSGEDVDMAGTITVNAGDADQQETQINRHVIPDAGIEDTTVYGRNVIAQFARYSGPNDLTVSLYRDGLFVETKSQSMDGGSINFSVDF